MVHEADGETRLSGSGRAGVDALQSLLKPYPVERMEGYAVDRLVNTMKNDVEECIEPIGEPPL